MSVQSSFEGEIAGILLKEDASEYKPQHPLWSFNWLWVTKKQFAQIMENQTKCFWVDDKVFCARDIRIARKFTYQELISEQYDWKMPAYLEYRLSKELAEDGNV